MKGKVERTEIHATFDVVVGLRAYLLSLGVVVVTLHVVGKSVVHRLSVVSTQSQSQTIGDIVVQSCGKAVFVGHFVFKWASGTCIDPSVAAELEAVESGKQLSLIAELPGASPETHARVVPCRGQNGVFALRAIDGEEVEWLVVGVE